MIKNNGIILLLFLLLVSCSTNNRAKEEVVVSEEAVEQQQAAAVAEIPKNPKVIRPEIVEGKAEVGIHKYENQTVDIEIESNGYKTLYAKLSANDPQANIRFSQIIMPDGSTDGPFGREITYRLPSDGLYHLIVTENKMAGEPWSGNFTLDVDLVPAESVVTMDIAQIDSIRIIYADDESLIREMSSSDIMQLIAWIKNSKYDQEWNDNDIMVKMVAPDYMLVITYRNRNNEGNDWLMIWKEDGRVKYRNVWYIMNEENTANISDLLERYRR